MKFGENWTCLHIDGVSAHSHFVCTPIGSKNYYNQLSSSVKSWPTSQVCSITNNSENCFVIHVPDQCDKSKKGITEKLTKRSEIRTCSGTYHNKAVYQVSVEYIEGYGGKKGLKNHSWYGRTESKPIVPSGKNWKGIKNNNKCSLTRNLNAGGGNIGSSNM